ncbi:MAG: SDR family oxidoreductase [Candidatus Nanohaloarchaea archaeon]
MKNINGKTAIITGASSGIGEATAHKLAENQASVVLASRSKEKLEGIADEIEEKHGVKTKVIPTDVTDEKEVENLFEKTQKEFGEIDIVISNAGLAMSGEVEEMPTEHYRKNNGVNIDGMFFTGREAIPYLKETEGNLIFLGSIAGKYPRGGNPVYAASKAWTISFTKNLSAQIGDSGVAVTVVNPSEVRTDFNSEEGTAFKEAFEEGSVTEPESIAEGILFAAKQESTNTVEELDLFRRDKLSDMELG